jgi:hypothetical protein
VSWFFASVPEFLACFDHDIMTPMPSAQCAFNEGFSDYFALAVNSQWIYRDWCYDYFDPGPCDPYPNGVDLEHQWLTDGRPQGELVEGRVAGALYDLTDPWPDFLDHQQDSFGFVATDLGSASTPHDFYQNWGGHSASCIFYNNTIDYGGCTIYRVYLPLLMNQ